MEIPGIRTQTELAALNAPTPSDNDEALGKTAFLELMIAQIRNQDPLDPSKNEEFVAQLAQFSSVEGIQNLNESMADMADSIRAGLTLDAAGIVGRAVMVPSQLASLEGDGVVGTISHGQASSNLIVEISQPNGELVRRLELGAKTEGEVRFAWDGLDEIGAAQPNGLYRVRAFSEAGNDTTEFNVNLPDRVVSVSIRDSGAVANLASGTVLPVAQIQELR